MPGRGAAAAVGVAVAAMALSAPAASAQAPAAQVQARGNPFSAAADLRFAPARTAVHVGEVVRWTNVDPFVPHTATEEHGLWHLGGGYGATPANPPGFGPGESVQRSFEAGTHQYLCAIHPRMRGQVDVPVQLSATRRRVVRYRTVLGRVPGRRRPLRVRVRVSRMVTDVAMRWAPAPAPGDHVYDVEVRRDGGAFVRYATGTRRPEGALVALRPHQRVEVRSRLRRIADDSAATDWSPLVELST